MMFKFILFFSLAILCTDINAQITCADIDYSRIGRFEYNQLPLNNLCINEPTFFYVMEVKIGQPSQTNSPPVNLILDLANINTDFFTPITSYVIVERTDGNHISTINYSVNGSIGDYSVNLDNVVIPAESATTILIKVPFTLNVARAVSAPTVWTGWTWGYDVKIGGSICTPIDPNRFRTINIGLPNINFVPEFSGPWSTTVSGTRIFQEENQIEGSLDVDLPVCEIGFSNIVSTTLLDLWMNEGAAIRVLSGNSLTCTTFEFKPCQGSSWQGIVVESGATLVMDNCRVSGAETAIVLEEGATLDLSDTEFRNCGVAILALGDVEIIGLESNTFRDCNVGVQLQDAPETNLDAGSSQTANNFASCTYGVKMYNSSATIRYNNFESCRYGIQDRNSQGRSQVYNNDIGYLYYGIDCEGSEMNIVHNDIGFSRSGRVLDRGFRGVSAAFSNVDVVDNYMGANKYGVYYYFNFNDSNSTIGSNIIELGGSDVVETFGISTFLSSGVEINDNKIYGYGQKGAIVSSSSPDKITNNSIYATCENGIALLGSTQRSEVIQNDITSNPGNAIYVQNNRNNVIHDNDVTATGVGLWVRPNSNTQVISCNKFLSGSTDIRNQQSQLGVQRHTNNIFRDVGSFAEQTGVGSEFSRFIVDELAPNLNMLRPEDFQPGNGDCEEDGAFFECLKSNGNGTACSDVVGSGLTPGPSPDPCEAVAIIKDLRGVNNRAYWIGFNQFLRQQNPEGGRPPTPEPCYDIGPDYDADLDCGIHYLAEMEVALRSAMSARHEENMGDATPRVSNLPQVRQLAQQQRAELLTEENRLACSNETYEIYRTTYVALLGYIIDHSLSETEKQSVTSISQLCPDAYGEVVDWARGLRATFDDMAMYDDSVCLQDELGPREKVIEAVVEKKVSLTPNPAIDYITLRNPNNTARSFSIFGMNGHQLSSGMISSNGSKRIDISAFHSGIYLLKISDAADNFLNHIKFIKE